MARFEIRDGLLVSLLALFAFLALLGRPGRVLLRPLTRDPFRARPRPALVGSVARQPIVDFAVQRPCVPATWPQAEVLRDPLDGVAPGQTAVLYLGTRVLGQFTIDRTVSAVPA